MRKSLNRIASIATSIAMVSTMLLTAAPVHAASPISVVSDTLTREARNANADHVLVFTSPDVSASSTWVTANDLTFTYAGFTNGAGTATVDDPSATAAMTLGGNTLVLHCVTTCVGLTYTVSGFSMDNPPSANAATVTVTDGNGVNGVTGSYSIPIMDSDQVTISASVAVAVTFDIDTQAVSNGAGHVITDTTESAAPYNVNLGVISLADGRVSGTGDVVNFIMLDLSSNAQGGTVITVHNLHDTDGLVSASVPGDTIPTATATMANGTANYGICSVGTSVAAAGGVLTAVSPFNDALCAGNSETNHVGGLTAAPQDIYNTGGNPVTLGRAQIAVSGAISTATASHDDYSDILTFIATGTF